MTFTDLLNEAFRDKDGAGFTVALFMSSSHQNTLLASIATELRKAIVVPGGEIKASQIINSGGMRAR